jgi:hypothetical protein
MNLQGTYIDRSDGSRVSGWIFLGVGNVDDLIFSNGVSGGTGFATVELYESPEVTYTERSYLYTPTLVWGWDAVGSVWRWLESGETGYADLVAAGGGRYHQNIVTVSHGKIYYGSVT